MLKLITILAATAATTTGSNLRTTSGGQLLVSAPTAAECRVHSAKTSVACADDKVCTAGDGKGLKKKLAKPLCKEAGCRMPDNECVPPIGDSTDDDVDTETETTEDQSQDQSTDPVDTGSEDTQTKTETKTTTSAGPTADECIVHSAKTSKACADDNLCTAGGGKGLKKKLAKPLCKEAGCRMPDNECVPPVGAATDEEEESVGESQPTEDTEDDSEDTETESTDSKTTPPVGESTDEDDESVSEHSEGEETESATSAGPTADECIVHSAKTSKACADDNLCTAGGGKGLKKKLAKPLCKEAGCRMPDNECVPPVGAATSM